MKAKKITAEDRKEMKAIVSKLGEREKDEVLADLVLFAQRAIVILDDLTKHSTLTPKEKREIEDSISVGPQWLRYSRRIKRQK
ncbi:hypothetical protein COU18_01605 [Candidatus Kaiserbacteria bacterium CG10_big_fil_rev_8_21_14_0_10_51_14]|uniref:Uncharacterized protein n=1 Tax=Candidatus Kaiserbacteria bacterium CG10_big_fil_rev_8_21_14_0_10_51_14 TaxID=1974610 RepID=A0A2H0UCC0_9BACT|nr:MAG: hypothetical protein COU18_01605 [Candidatus Kaiserbacteria bacterium CG10_big_fil_rev_8_21_14_0_10_51_14]